MFNDVDIASSWCDPFCSVSV